MFSPDAVIVTVRDAVHELMTRLTGLGMNRKYVDHLQTCRCIDVLVVVFCVVM